MINRKAIAVYDPADPWERSIQDASHRFTGEWLSAYQCKLMADAIASLKIFDDWMSAPTLYDTRAAYFFAPQMVRDKQQLVFVTHMLFLRDIMENREINSYLHDPVVFMTRPLAHYLFREYEIHLLIDYGVLKTENSADFVEIGGLVIASQQNIRVSESIMSVNSKPGYDLQQHVRQDDLQNIAKQTGLKAASKEISRGVFQISEHERELEPEMKVWDKDKREQGTISFVEPGETGIINVRFPDGREVSVTKHLFDNRFSVV